MEKVSFGERLRECRAEKGLTQAQLAARLSVTQSTVGKYERGALQPNLEMLVQLCKVGWCKYGAKILHAGAQGLAMRVLL